MQMVDWLCDQHLLDAVVTARHHVDPLAITVGFSLCKEFWRKISTVWWMFSLQERSCLAAIIARLTGSGKNSCFQAVLYWPWSTFSNSEKEWVQLRFICMPHCWIRGLSWCLVDGELDSEFATVLVDFSFHLVVQVIDLQLVGLSERRFLIPDLW